MSMLQHTLKSFLMKMNQQTSKSVTKNDSCYLGDIWIVISIWASKQKLARIDIFASPYVYYYSEVSEVTNIIFGHTL